MISLFFPYLIKWTQKDIQTKDFFVFNNNGNIIAKWLLQLLRTIFSFQAIDASLSLSKKKNENFPSEQVSYFLKWPAVPP